MNTNNSCPTCSPNSKPFPIRLAPMPTDGRLAFVESVCQALSDSRFGPGRSKHLVVHLSEWPELAPAVFCDLTIEGPIPSYTILPNSEIARRVTQELIYQELERCALEWFSTRGQNASPSTLGRGSPLKSEKVKTCKS